jgi:hypothetical protein
LDATNAIAEALGVPFATLIAEAKQSGGAAGRLLVELFNAPVFAQNKNGFLEWWCWLRRMTV